ncbi:MAG: DUF2179 domain-containing protein [Candidatus Izemoplasmatales bacterium]|uniref:DUF2179 domain-containing protein n=1 Tax=Hujiaoplasma nucleasis TaxID=2725268 RepID=A0A7L6N5T1_9MOLU|nr:DUF5698 domain-containing protein [Hujiaoplasma nucleasis]QLY39929.1 DUF2179 domain-containing protein [Hujiaoplasma nucleasis]
MWDTIWEFLSSVPLWEVLLILGAKIVEVSISTLRIIFIGKGLRKPGTILALIEILLWVFIASSVINGITEAPLKGIYYGIGFAVGVYLGSIIEDKIGVGKILIQAIIMKEEAKNVTNALRDAGYAVTSINAYGKYKEREVLMIFANRKNKLNIVKLINETDDDALVVSNDVSMVSGGFVSPWRRLIK